MNILDIVIVLILSHFAKIVYDSVVCNIRCLCQISLSNFCSLLLGACIGGLICIGAYLRRFQSTIDREQELSIKNLKKFKPHMSNQTSNGMKETDL